MRSRDEVLALLLDDRTRFATVSGVLTTRPALMEWVDRSVPEIDVITTKSYQVDSNPGNREPILFEQAGGSFGNAVGLANPGMETGARELEGLRLRALLNVSLAAGCAEDFVRLVRRFQGVADILELNLSCPHARDGSGAAVGSSPAMVRELVSEIRRETGAPLLAKLTPNVEAVGKLALAALEGGADGIAAINTVGPEVFREPSTGAPVLTSPVGGGRSGEWIKRVALDKVAEIREAVGGGVPIIGMGGVATGRDAAQMLEAGADVVGLGSVFAQVPRQGLIPRYVAALRRDCAEATDTAGAFLASERLMHYRSYSIREVWTISEELRVFVLDGCLTCRPSQYAFLFIPGVGEKPFSVAREDPLTFVVRRRGPFTRALFSLGPGDPLLVRGLYGEDAPYIDRTKAYVVAGGTGVAVTPGLVEELRRRGKDVSVYVGVTSSDEVRLGELVPAAQGACVTVADRGRVGRVLEVLGERLEMERPGQAAFYNVGPFAFRRRAAELERRHGADPREVFVSLETPSRCGVGLCGSCQIGGRLLCKEGTFVSLAFLDRHGWPVEEEKRACPSRSSG